MSNFSDFFPAAGGGGEFTKSNSYSTARALASFTYNNAASYTVNPATDLGLEDGAPLGYFLVGGGGMSNTKDMGAFGGMIIQGITTIVTAATDIILTPGVGHVVNTVDGSAGYDYNATGAALQSTITGGLSLTTADGHNGSGFGGTTLAGYGASAGSGINGYGAGGAPGDFRANSSYGYGWTGGNNRVAHGFGVGGAGGMTVALGAFEGSDGAIILFY
jgi:hypothetical protein